MSLLEGYTSDSSNDSDLSKEASVKSEDKLYSSKFNPNPEVCAPTDNTKQITRTKPSNTSVTVTGYIQNAYIDDLKFKTNKRFHDSGNHWSNKLDTKRIKKQRKSKGNSTTTDPFDIELYKGPWAGYSSSDKEGDESERDGEESTVESAPATTAEITEASTDKLPTETSDIFCSKTLNYITEIPKSLQGKGRPGSQECFVPKRKKHVYEGHRGGVQHLQFFPQTGHLLLSCGNDNLIKLWDVYHRKRLLRIFKGHKKAVKFVQFNSDGSKFISCSYDKTVKLWNTLTGECEHKLKLKAVPNMVKFSPTNENEVLIALANKRIEHYDIKINELIQEYTHHMSSISFIEFLPSGEQFISSSDDKSIKVWNSRINMPVKQISDPKQYSMPCLTLHPNKSYFVAQSMDNQILTFSTLKSEKFKKNKKKTFKGHNNSGYNIELCFTPDGKNLISGDSFGYVYFWDWSNCKVVKKLKVDEQLVSCVDSHPLETSLVAVGGLSGKIYLYD